MFVLKMHLLLRWVSGFFCASISASLVVQLVKNPPAMQETLVRFLGREDPLEKGMATTSGAAVHRVTKSQTQLRG